MRHILLLAVIRVDLADANLNTRRFHTMHH